MNARIVIEMKEETKAIVQNTAKRRRVTVKDLLLGSVTDALAVEKGA